MKWNNRAKISILVGSVIVSSLASVILFNGLAHSEWDLPGLSQQVQHVTEVTDNHEARISNIEAKVNTPTDEAAPAPKPVPQVTTPSATAPVLGVQSTPEPTVTPAPDVTVSSTSNECRDGISWTILHYSDGTTKAMTGINPASCTTITQ